jgi:hypothetical protein
MLVVRDQMAELLDTIRLSDPIQPVPSFDDDLSENGETTLQ